MRLYKILVVDEVGAGLEIMAILCEAGFEAAGPVATVSGALISLEISQFDAVLLDTTLSGVPSFPVAEALKQRLIPFAFVTAASPFSLPYELRDAPMLGKPFQEKRLLSLTRSLLTSPSRECVDSLCVVAE